MYEAPKGIAWLAYVLIWLANRAVARDFGGRLGWRDTLIAAWIASGFVVAAFAGLHGSEWRAALDIVRYGSVLWIVKRSRLAEREVELVLTALVAATVIGLAMAYAQPPRARRARLELNSVGHVNHTAVYLAIMLGVCASWLFTGRHRVVLGAIALLVLVSVFVAASRAGVGVALLTLVVLSIFWWPRSRVPAIIAVAVLVITAALFYSVAQRCSSGTRRTSRPARRSPSATGRGSSPSIPGESIPFSASAWTISRWSRAQTGDPYAALFPHAHNLYLNTLAERGIVGAAPVLIVMVAWPLALLRRRPRVADGKLDWTVWGAALGAWLVTAVVGLVNTTLHHEHGLLAVLLLGLWLARRAHQR